MIEHQEGKGGAWGVTHDERGLVLVRFERGDALHIFQCELTPEVAVQLAQSLVRHAMRAGHGGPDDGPGLLQR